jgi:small-conductance mechanosensitive channel
MIDSFIALLAVFVVPPAAVALMPGWIAFEASRYFILVRGPIWQIGNDSQDSDDEFYLDTVLGAMAAAIVCLITYATIIIIARTWLPEGVGDYRHEQIRAYFLIFSFPVASAILIWLYIQFFFMVRTAFKSPIVQAVVHIYVTVYILLAVLAKVIPTGTGDHTSGVTIVKIVSYGFANMLMHLLSGPIFIAEKIADSSQLDRWMTFAFMFLVLLSCQKYALHIFLKVYGQGRGADAWDLKAINAALTVFVWLTSIVASISTLQIDAWSVGVFTALVGAGVSISFRDLLNNFFSGILLNLDNSIKKGDVIRTADGTVGEVIQNSLRYTQLQTKDNVDILIPNSVLVQTKFENFTRTKDDVRLSLRFLVGLSVDIDKAERIVLRACRLVPEISAVANRTPVLFYLGPSERGNQFDLRFWVSDPRPGPAKFQSDVAKAIYRQFKRDNIPLPMMYNMNINVDGDTEINLTAEARAMGAAR